MSTCCSFTIVAYFSPLNWAEGVIVCFAIFVLWMPPTDAKENCLAAALLHFHFAHQALTLIRLRTAMDVTKSVVYFHSLVQITVTHWFTTGFAHFLAFEWRAVLSLSVTFERLSFNSITWKVDWYVYSKGWRYFEAFPWQYPLWSIDLNMFGQAIDARSSKTEFRFAEVIPLQYYNVLAAHHTIFVNPGSDETGLCRKPYVVQMTKTRVKISWYVAHR